MEETTTCELVSNEEESLSSMMEREFDTRINSMLTCQRSEVIVDTTDTRNEELVNEKNVNQVVAIPMSTSLLSEKTSSSSSLPINPTTTQLKTLPLKGIKQYQPYKCPNKNKTMSSEEQQVIVSKEQVVVSNCVSKSSSSCETSLNDELNQTELRTISESSKSPLISGPSAEQLIRQNSCRLIRKKVIRRKKAQVHDHLTELEQILEKFNMKVYHDCPTTATTTINGNDVQSPSSKLMNVTEEDESLLPTELTSTINNSTKLNVNESELRQTNSNELINSSELTNNNSIGLIEVIDFIKRKFVSSFTSTTTTTVDGNDDMDTLPSDTITTGSTSTSSLINHEKDDKNDEMKISLTDQSSSSKCSHDNDEEHVNDVNNDSSSFASSSSFATSSSSAPSCVSSSSSSFGEKVLLLEELDDEDEEEDNNSSLIKCINYENDNFEEENIFQEDDDEDDDECYEDAKYDLFSLTDYQEEYLMEAEDANMFCVGVKSSSANQQVNQAEDDSDEDEDDPSMAAIKLLTWSKRRSLCSRATSSASSSGVSSTGSSFSSGPSTSCSPSSSFNCGSSASGASSAGRTKYQQAKMLRRGLSINVGTATTSSGNNENDDSIGDLCISFNSVSSSGASSASSSSSSGCSSESKTRTIKLGRNASFQSTLISRRPSIKKLTAKKSKKCFLASTESLFDEINNSSQSSLLSSKSINKFSCDSLNHQSRRRTIMKSYNLNDFNTFNTGTTTIITLTPIKTINNCSFNKSSRNNISNNNTNNNNISSNGTKLRYIDHVIRELIETEVSYVKDLRDIIEGYVKPLRSQAMNNNFNKNISSNVNDNNSNTKSNTLNNNQVTTIIMDKRRCSKTLPPVKVTMEPGRLTMNEVKDLFGNIEEIYVFSANFLDQLKSCNSDPDLISRAFIQQSFDVYTHYCAQQYPKMVTTLTELLKRPEICCLFRERQNSLNHFLPLGSYLLKPVQRILKYPLLLQSIVKHTSSEETKPPKDVPDDDHEDEGCVNDEDDEAEDDNKQTKKLITITPDPNEAKHALEVMTNYAYHINEVKRKHELYLSQLNELKRKQEVNPFKFIKSFMKKTNNVFVRVCKTSTNTKIHPK